MDHNAARATAAAERYLLDEMPPGERDEFEEHYFDCAECGADVRDTARFMATARSVVREGAVVQPIRSSPRWRGWVPQAAAASLLGLVLGWVAPLQTIRNVPVPAIAVIDVQYEVDTSESRGAGDAAAIRIPHGQLPALNFYIPPRDEAASYLIRVRDGAGRVELKQPVSRERAAESISLELRALPRGSYKVVIEGVRKDGNPFPITQFPVEVGER